MIQRVLCLFLLLMVSAPIKGNHPCDQENPSIKILKEAHVMIHSQPVFTSSSCGDEWRLYGSCCDFETLKTAVLTDVQSIKEDTNKLVGTISAVIKVFGKLKKGPLDEKKNRAKLLQAALKGKGFQILEQMSIQKISREANICWGEMAKTRSASVCTTCSGRSQVFFNNQKALVTQEVCSRVVDKCKPHLELLSVMSVLAQTVGKSMDESSTLAASTKDKLKRIEAVFCSASSPMPECQNGSKGDINDWICSKFVRLREKTLLKEIEPLFANLKEILDDVMSRLKIGRSATPDESQNESGKQDNNSNGNGDMLLGKFSITKVNLMVM